MPAGRAVAAGRAQLAGRSAGWIRGPLEGCLGCDEVRADARGLRALLVVVELGLDAGLVGDRVGELMGVLERLADVGLCLVGAALALEDGDLGLADPFRDGGRGVLESLDETEFLLEH